ncbi:MAG: hypothetical protein ABI321_01585 [Polyangia bacterium]
MSHRFAALALVLGAILFASSAAAFWVGATDTLLATSGPRRSIAVEDLPLHSRGWYLLSTCIRHDLAVVVTSAGTAYKLGEPGIESDDTDRIYTPLAARSDCDDDRPPRHVYALVEDADAVNTTFARGGHARIAPPPIEGTVEGTIGPRVGDRSRARQAARKLAVELPGVEGVPLVHKDGHPGPLWLGLVTMAVGLHGIVLLVIAGLYYRRRALRREDLRTGALDDAEERFFETETLE